MKIKNVFPKLFATGVVLTIAVSALANPIDNPQNADILAPSASGINSYDSILKFNSTYLINFSKPANNTDINADFASNGDLTYQSSTFDPIATGYSLGANGVKAQIILGGGTPASGNLNAVSGNFSLTLNLRVKFTDGNNSITTTCQTGFVTVALKNDGSTTFPGTSLHGVAYNSATGTFTVTSSGFTIPALSSGCGSAANQAALNSAFSLGSSGVAGIKFDVGSIAPILVGS